MHIVLRKNVSNQEKNQVQWKLRLKKITAIEKLNSQFTLTGPVDIMKNMYGQNSFKIH